MLRCLQPASRRSSGRALRAGQLRRVRAAESAAQTTAASPWVRSAGTGRADAAGTRTAPIAAVVVASLPHATGARLARLPAEAPAPPVDLEPHERAPRALDAPARGELVDEAQAEAPVAGLVGIEAGTGVEDLDAGVAGRHRRTHADLAAAAVTDGVGDDLGQEERDRVLEVGVQPVRGERMPGTARRLGHRRQRERQRW